MNTKLGTLLALALSAPLATAFARVDPPVVLTSFYPTTFLTERIGGAAIRVECPIPEDEDPAFWEPARETLRRYQQADLVVLNGAGLERWPSWTSLAPSRVVTSAAPFQDQWMRYEDAASHGHGPEGEHAHEGFDGHTWLDPLLAIEQAREIHRGLLRVAPEASADLDRGLVSLTGELEALDATLRAIPAPAAGEIVFASHPAYRYLARRYSWPVVSLDFDPEELPSTEALDAARELLGARRARWIWWESQPTDAVAARVDAALGVRSVVVSPIEAAPGGGQDFLDVQQRNAQVIASTFQPETEHQDS